MDDGVRLRLRDAQLLLGILDGLAAEADAKIGKCPDPKQGGFWDAMYHDRGLMYEEIAERLRSAIRKSERAA